MSSGRCTLAATAAGSAAAGWSKIPIENMVRAIRLTMSSRRDIGTCPSCTAVFNGAVKYWPGLTSISMSSPALAAATVECVPPQSDITKPVKPN
jgi:hypothetical protein